MRRLLRKTWKVGLLAGIAYVIWRAYQSRAETAGDGAVWEPAPFPFPPVPRPPAGTWGEAEHHVHIPTGVEPGGGPETGVSAHDVAPWTEPIDGECPLSHPVKAKLGSGIYHLPGGGSYERTKPDRCYLDAAAAEADGLRPAKR